MISSLCSKAPSASCTSAVKLSHICSLRPPPQSSPLAPHPGGELSQGFHLALESPLETSLLRPSASTRDPGDFGAGQPRGTRSRWGPRRRWGWGCGAHTSLLVPWGSFGKKTEVCGVCGRALPGRAERSTDSMLLCLSPSQGRMRGSELTGSPCPGRPPSRSSHSSRPGTRGARTSSVLSTPEG